MDKTSRPSIMVMKAIELNRELDGIKAFMRKVWLYETVYLERPTEHIMGNSYHVYLDPSVIRVWNNVRCSQLILNRVLREQLLKGLEQNSPVLTVRETQRQLDASEKSTQKAIADICASTPQIIGQIASPDISSSLYGSFLSTLDSNPSPKLFDPGQKRFRLHPPGTFLNPSRPTGMSHLIFPLYTMAYTLGTKQPLVLVQRLEKKLKSGLAPKLWDKHVLSRLA
jgi:hypothetical protein